MHNDKNLYEWMKKRKSATTKEIIDAGFLENHIQGLRVLKLVKSEKDFHQILEVSKANSENNTEVNFNEKNSYKTVVVSGEKPKQIKCADGFLLNFGHGWCQEFGFIYVRNSTKKISRLE